MLSIRRRDAVLLLGMVASTSCAAGPEATKHQVANMSIPSAPESTAAEPPPPRAPARRKKIDDGTYTVWGALSAFQSPAERADVDGKQITVEGYIVATNLAEAPRCAVHKTGEADPEGCSAPLPELWLADSPDAPTSEALCVLGWASNYANVFDAIRKQKAVQPEEHVDAIWGVTLPNPLPARGAKVRVVATYGATFRMSSSGIVAAPEKGLLTYKSMQTLEPAPEPATLPGM